MTPVGSSLANVLLMPLPQAKLPAFQGSGALAPSHVQSFLTLGHLLKGQGHQVAMDADSVAETSRDVFPLAELYREVEPGCMGIDLHSIRDRFQLIVADGLSPLGPLLAREAKLPCLVLQTTLPPLRLKGDRGRWFPASMRTPVFYGFTSMVACPSEFEIAENVRSRAAYGGPLLWQSLAPIEVHAESQRPLVFASVGTRSDHSPEHVAFLKRLLASAALFPHADLVFAAGDLFDALTSVPRPSNVTLVKHTRQFELLHRARLFITHGGLNSVKEALYCGVPMLVIPSRDDQFDNAARVKWHGCGLVADHHLATSIAIARNVDRLLSDETFRRAAEQMRLYFIDETRNEVYLDLVQRAIEGGAEVPS